MILTKIFFIKIATVPMYVQELLSIDISVSTMYLQCVLLQCTSSRSVVQPPAAQQSPGVGGAGGGTGGGEGGGVVDGAAPVSPIVSHNEVSSSRQDPADNTVDNLADNLVDNLVDNSAVERDQELSRSPSPAAGLGGPPPVSWHHPALPLTPPPGPLPAPPVVPLLLPCTYPSLSHR